MASVAVSNLSKMEHDQLCCAYSALMLHDDGLEINVSTYISKMAGRQALQGHQSQRKSG